MSEENVLDLWQKTFHQAVTLNASDLQIELATGTGQLPETLQIISNHHENKLNEVMDHLEQMIEPILMLIMGFLIGTIVVALYLPIFEMGHSL